MKSNFKKKHLNAKTNTDKIAFVYAESRRDGFNFCMCGLTVQTAMSSI